MKALWGRNKSFCPWQGLRKHFTGAGAGMEGLHRSGVERMVGSCQRLEGGLM